MPGTAAEPSLRVKSCIALTFHRLYTHPLRFIRKETKSLLFQVYFGLWACRSHWERVLCCSVFSYHDADSVSLLICNAFCFPCKKNRRNGLLFTLWPFLCCLLLAFAFPLYFTVSPFCKMVLFADWCSCFLTALHTDHLLLHSQRSHCVWLPSIPQPLASWRQIRSV